ncbi:MAG: Txe/YoeB family addiction module toxin [bacterium]
MKIEYTSTFKNDFDYWINHDKKVAERILLLISSIKETPFTGIGKPEPLKYEFSGCWSRRINKEHRIVYSAWSKTIQLLSCRYHY